MIRGKQKTVGIAGTAKNTGKTTTTVALLNHFQSRGVSLGLTSIGYDGETIDNVTGLPKPRIFAPKGIWVVTAERCLEASSAKIAVKERLAIGTPLGKLVGGVVEREGLLVTAGPNQSCYVREVREWLYREGVELVIVDGALNRIAPMVEADGLILATGAAYMVDIHDLALHAHYLDIICSCREPELLPEKLAEFATTVMWNASGKIIAETGVSLLNPFQLEPFRDVSSFAAGLYCPGVIMPGCLKRLMDFPFSKGMQYIFSDPTKLILGNDVAMVHDFLEWTTLKEGSVSYKKALPLVAITVNPFYPNFRYETNNYEPAFVDREKLLTHVSALISVPVLDVVSDGCEQLAKIIL